MAHNLVSLRYMITNLVRPENWDELNDKIGHILKMPPKARVRCYQGMAHALFETLQSTAQFMTHKKSVAFISGQTPYLEALLPYYYKEGYDVLNQSQLEAQDLKEWVEGLKRDTLFVVYSEDHPVTGETYPFASELDRLLNEKRIYSISISHRKHLSSEEQLRPYSVRLCEYTGACSVAHLGERFRSPALLASAMPWDEVAMIEAITLSRKNFLENKEQILSFEDECEKTFSKKVFSFDSRVYDRALIVLPDTSADAVRDNLLKKMNLSSEQGQEILDTTNKCTWNSQKLFSNWWMPRPSEDTLRGLLVVSLQALSIKDFAKLLRSSYEEIKAQQSWEL